MTGAEIRQKFSRFLSRKAARDCAIVVAHADAPNLLFTNAGMNQFVPIFLASKAAVEAAARGRHAEMHSRRRET